MPRDGWRDDYIEPSGRMAPFSHDEEGTGWQLQRGPQDTNPGRHRRLCVAPTRITWQEGAEPVLMFDLGHALSGTSVVAGEASYVSDEVLHDFISPAGYSSRFGGVKSWFEATFDPQPIATGGWSEAWSSRMHFRRRHQRRTLADVSRRHHGGGDAWPSQR